MPSPVTSHPRHHLSPAVLHPSASSRHVTVTLRACQKSLRWQITRGTALAASAYACTPSPQWKFSICQRRVSINVALVIYTLGGWGGGGQKPRVRFSALRWRRLNTNQRSDLSWSFIKRCPRSGSRVVSSRSLPVGIRRELWAKG